MAIASKLDPCYPSFTLKQALENKEHMAVSIAVVFDESPAACYS